MDIPDLSSYPQWAKISIILLVASILGILFLARKSLTPGEIVIDDIIHSSFPAVIDFRVRNSGNVTTAITKVLFKIVRVEQAMSMIAKQEPSDQGALLLGPDVAQGDVLEVPVALKVAGMDTDRITINFSWNQAQPKSGYYFLVIPVLKTSSGFVRGKSLVLHIQQSEDSFSERSPSGLNNRPPPTWDESETAGLNYDWAAEEKQTRQIKRAKKK